MEFKTRQQLQTLKKMAQSYYQVCQQIEIETASFTGEKSLFFDMISDETHRMIAEINAELQTLEG